MGALHKSDSHVQRIKVVPSLSDSWQPKDSHVESTLKSLKKKYCQIDLKMQCCQIGDFV